MTVPKWESDDADDSTVAHRIDAAEKSLHIGIDRVAVIDPELAGDLRFYADVLAKAAWEANTRAALAEKHAARALAGINKYEDPVARCSLGIHDASGTRYFFGNLCDPGPGRPCPECGVPFYTQFDEERVARRLMDDLVGGDAHGR